MARDSSGAFALVAGNPVVSGTTIQSAWANNTLTDIANAISDSLDRFGRGGMLAAFKALDGTPALPGITFTSELGMGISRFAAGVMTFSTAGGERIRIGATGSVTVNAPTAGTALMVNGLAGAVGVQASADFSANWALQLTSSAVSTGRVGILFDRVGGAAKQWVVGNDTDGGTDNSFDIRDLTRGAIPFAISTTGNVAIGTPSAGIALDVAGLIRTLGGLQLVVTGFTSVLSSDGSGTYLDAVGATNLFRIYTNSVQRLAITATGNMTIAAPTAGVALTVTGVAGQPTAAFSNGISVGNAANANANVLDWYEEGTFTPTLTFGGAAVGLTYTTQLGWFTRIGDRIHFGLRIVLSAKGSSVGSAQIGGLPYAMGGASRRESYSMSPFTGFVGLTGATQGYGNSGASTISPYQLGTTGMTILADTSFSNTSEFTISGSYGV